MEVHRRPQATPFWRRREILVSAVLACTTRARAQADGTGPVVSARRLVEATPDSRRAALLHPFSEDARSNWNYTPRRRDGITWKAMSAAQREAMTALLRSALNDRGVDKVRALMALEITLRELESSSESYRDPDNYAVALYGTPGEGGWGWRFEGHHLSLHFSLDGDRYVASLPQFLGANPAEVPRDVAGGPKSGFRLLGAEEDLAREWLGSLNSTQRRQAVFDSRPYGDIVSRNAARAESLDEVGLPWESMDAGQQARVLKLIAVFAAHLQPALAEARLLRVRSAPLASIRIGWAGSTQPRQPHYFRIQGAGFLIEYDNSGGNHVHSVWRDFEGDFGRDVLREHYQRAKGRGHRHGGQ